MRVALILLVLLLSGCEENEFRRDRIIHRICPGGLVVYEWKGNYWVWTAGRWTETHKDACA